MVSSTNISSLFTAISGFDTISVADYQRNYSWNSNNIEELWSDLLLVTSDRKSHFLGSLILQIDADNPVKCEIVDGQQRLTTIFILMARLRDEVRRLSSQTIRASSATERDIPVLSEIEKFLYVGSSTRSKYNSNLLIKTHFDEALKPESGFPVIPRNNNAIPRRDSSESRGITLDFRKAYWQIKKLVEDDLTAHVAEEEKLLRIKALADGLVMHMNVLPIMTSSTGESLDVFMTINDRGLPLGVFDLVRGYILTTTTANLPETQRLAKFRQVHQEWEVVLTNIAGSDPDKFLRHFLLSIQPRKVTSRAISSTAIGLIGDVRGGKTPSQNADDLWSQIQSASLIYSDLKTPPVGKCQTQLHALNIIADSYRVLLLKVLDPAIALSKRHQEEIVGLVFRVALSWPILGRNAQVLEGEFQTICQKLKSVQDVGEVVADLTALAPTAADAQGYFSDGISSAWAKAMLLSIEDAISGRAVVLNPEHYQIEHIAPQTATPHWEAVLRLTGEDYKEMIERPGNLTLLDAPINRQIQQRPFKDASGVDKVSEYARSRTNMSSDLATLPSWENLSIERRTKWFMDQVNKLINSSSGTIETFSTWLVSNP
ncbi:MAG TPA: DUF262 domain-containing HNH endonuclease family protein [Candidatus Paceibacterota bacterium]|nr:DUF262 domain-containing HNH endonuclease family protein [Candidatus Paceibacterota bacterium]